MPDDNTPRNILEEIVWFKAREIEAWREKTPLVMLQVAAKNAEPARDFRAAILQKAQETGALCHGDA